MVDRVGIQDAKESQSQSQATFREHQTKYGNLQKLVDPRGSSRTAPDTSLYFSKMTAKACVLPMFPSIVNKIIRNYMKKYSN